MRFDDDDNTKTIDILSAQNEKFTFCVFVSSNVFRVLPASNYAISHKAIKSTQETESFLDLTAVWLGPMGDPQQHKTVRNINKIIKN